MSCVFVQLSQHKYSLLQNMCTMQTWLSHVSLWKSNTCSKNHLSNENLKNPNNVCIATESDCSYWCLFSCYEQQIPKFILFPPASSIFWLYCNCILSSNILKRSSQLSLSLTCPPILGTATLFPYVSLPKTCHLWKTSVPFAPFLSSHGHSDTNKS